MNSENKNEYFTFSFPMEDGKEMECQVLTTLLVDGKTYVALLPIDDADSDNDDVFFYQYIDREGQDPEIKDIENDEEFENVADAFEEYLDTLEFEELVSGDDSEDEENE